MCKKSQNFCVLSGSENLFIIQRIFIEHLSMPDNVLGIKIILKEKSKLKDSEICHKLLNEQ